MSDESGDGSVNITEMTAYTTAATVQAMMPMLIQQEGVRQTIERYFELVDQYAKHGALSPRDLILLAHKADDEAKAIRAVLGGGCVCERCKGGAPA